MSHSSPYQPPRSPITPTAPTQFGEIKVLSAQGRLGRVRYIGYSIGIGILINIVAALVGGLATLLGGSGDTAEWLTGGGIVILALAALVISILLAIQRLHDFNASGWWSALTIVPLANLIFYLVLLIMPGVPGPNRFGDPPPPNTTGVIILASLLPLIFVIGIIAAIAIPAYQSYIERAREATPNSAPAQQ